METIWSKKSDDILRVGCFLGSVGVRNWALTKEQSLIALNNFEDEGIAILGGDVYEMGSEGLQPNYDSWYCERKENEKMSLYLSRSILKARNYIVNYKSKRKTECFFVIVPES